MEHPLLRVHKDIFNKIIHYTALRAEFIDAGIYSGESYYRRALYLLDSPFCLSSCFLFFETLEGFDFWSNINHMINDLNNDPNKYIDLVNGKIIIKTITYE